MQKQVKNEDSDFSRYSTNELFYYLLDNLLIAPDEEYETWGHYRQEMLDVATNFYKEHYLNIEA